MKADVYYDVKLGTVVFVNGQRTAGQYRAIDLSLFAVMVIVSETLLVNAATRWFPAEAYTVSATAALTAIVMIRWGPWAACHAALGGLVYCLVSGGKPGQYLIYCLGNELSFLMLPVLRRLGDERIRTDALKAMGFGLGVLLLMQLGRALTALALGASLTAVAGFFLTDPVSALFTLLIMWIVRRLDGMLEDQHHYLRRIQAEREKEEGGYR